MKALMIMVAVAFALASCNTTQSGKVDVAVQKNLPKICQGIDASYAVFVAAAGSGLVKQATIQKVSIAYSGVQPICDHPEQATAISVVTKVLLAANTIKSALNEVKK